MSAKTHTTIILSIDNIHTWIAETDTSFIDIILPNYDMVYRRCDYYKEHEPLAKVGQKTTIYYSQPDETFDMKLVKYKGNK